MRRSYQKRKAHSVFIPYTTMDTKIILMCIGIYVSSRYSNRGGDVTDVLSCQDSVRFYHHPTQTCISGQDIL